MVLCRIKIKKRQSGKSANFSWIKVFGIKRTSIPLRNSLNSQLSLLRENLGKLSLQKSSDFAFFQTGKKKPKFNFLPLATILRRIFTFGLIAMVILSQTALVFGFEAHVVNVTAKICDYSQTRSIDYWKTNPDIYKHFLPQTLGEEVIDTVSEADNILNFSGQTSNMRNKPEAQLLGMKFNIFYYHIGEYFVESEGHTLYEIIVEADALLLDPNATKSELENMKDLLDDLNNLHQIRSCPTGIVINEFLANPVGNDVELKKNGEWIELYNLGDAEVDLKGWAFYDLHDENELLITKFNTDSGSTIIKPKDFLIVYRNGNANFNLNNTFGDAIRLYNGNIDKGALIDIYSYTVDSLEGKSFALVPNGSTNWVDPLPTPGESNSLVGEYSEFGQAVLEAGEDTSVLNTDIEIVEETPQISDITLPDIPIVLPVDTIPENAVDSADSVPALILTDPMAETAGDISDKTIGDPAQSVAPAAANAIVQEQSMPISNIADNSVAEINNSGGSSAGGQATDINLDTQQTVNDAVLSANTVPASINTVESSPPLVEVVPPVLNLTPTPESIPEPTPALIPGLEPSPSPEVPAITPEPTLTPEPILTPELTPMLKPTPTPDISPAPELTPPIEEPASTLEPTPVSETAALLLSELSSEISEESVIVPAAEISSNDDSVITSESVQESSAL